MGGMGFVISQVRPRIGTLGTRPDLGTCRLSAYLRQELRPPTAQLSCDPILWMLRQHIS